MSLLNKIIPISKETLENEVEKARLDERVMYQKALDNIIVGYESKIEDLERQLKDSKKEIEKYLIFKNRLPIYYQIMFNAENTVSIVASREINSKY